jgi:cytochrome c551/c552
VIARSLLLAGGALVAGATSLVAAVARPGTDGSSALDGAALFVDKGCASCHDGPRSTAMVAVGPPLDDARAWAATRVDGQDAAAYLAASMRDPGAFISPAFTGGVGPATAMPRLALSDAEIEALVADLLASDPAVAADGQG